MSKKCYTGIQVYLTSDDIEKLEPELFEELIILMEDNNVDFVDIDLWEKDHKDLNSKVLSAYKKLKQTLLNNHNIDTILCYHEDEEGISDVQGEYWYVFDGLVQNPLISSNVEVKLGTTVSFG
jgi:hypothetical protein